MRLFKIKVPRMLRTYGFSVVEVLVALGLVSLIGAAIASVITNANKQQKGVQAKDQQRDVTGELRSLLSDKVACLNSFGGLGDPIFPGPGFTVTAIKEINGTDRYNTSTLSTDKSGLLTFQGFDISGWTALTGNANLKVRLLRTGDVGSSRELRPDIITLKVKRDVVSGQITECFAIGTQADSYWRPGTVDPNDIYFNSGNVAIGTTAPSTVLHTAYNLNLAYAPGSFASKGVTIQNTYNSGLNSAATLLFQVNDLSNIPATAAVNAIHMGGSDANAGLTFQVDSAAVPLEAMRITASGNVGIGTTTPVQPLHVSSGNTLGTGFELGNSTAGGRNYGVISSGSTSTGGAGKFHVYDYDTPRSIMVFDSLGNVGIGTTTPVSTFSVVETVTPNSGSKKMVDLNYTIDPTSNAVAGNSRVGLNIATTHPAANAFTVRRMGGVTATTDNASATGFYSIYGGNFNALNSGSSNGTNITGTYVSAGSSGGTVGTVTGVSVSTIVSAGTVSDVTGLNISYGASGGTVTNSYGINLTSTGGAATNNYAIYQGTTTDKSYFAGTVGIGTTAPAFSLDVNAPAAVGSRLWMDRDGADNSWLGARGTGTDLERAAIGIRSNSVTGVVDKIYLATSSANRLIIDSIGNVGIGVVMPGQKLDVAGNISASGNITAAAYLYTSDARLKKEITPLSNSLENILDIQGVHFLWRNPHIENAKALQIGLIAQQVRKVFPEVVVEGLDGKLQVNYPVLIAPIIEAIRSLYERIVSNQQQVEDLKKTVTLLQMDNYELAKRLDVLEQKISNLKRK